MEDRQAYDTDLTDAEWNRLEPLSRRAACLRTGVDQENVGDEFECASEQHPSGAQFGHL